MLEHDVVLPEAYFNFMPNMYETMWSVLAQESQRHLHDEQPRSSCRFLMILTYLYASTLRALHHRPYVPDTSDVSNVSPARPLPQKQVENQQRVPYKMAGLVTSAIACVQCADPKRNVCMLYLATHTCSAAYWMRSINIYQKEI